VDEILLSAAFANSLRLVYPRVVAKVYARTKSLADAEDAAQEAVLRALDRWPREGAPTSHEAWLVTVATNVGRDQQRRARREEPASDALEILAEMSPWVRSAVADEDIARQWKDELLALVFACCHPCLEPGEAAALAMATILGMSTREIAAAFVVAPRAIEQRLLRARKRLREQGDAEGTAPDAARPRLPAVLAVVHLLFNEGYWSTASESPIREDLCRLAIGLAKALATAFPDEPEASGLLALVLLHDARRAARLDVGGNTIALPNQDRTLWDHTAIANATRVLEVALAVGRPGRFQLEAAISAVHARATRAEDTDWREIAELYSILERLSPSPAVRVNRAFAVGRVSGPEAGLKLLEAGAMAAEYPYFHTVKSALLRELGRGAEAARALVLAIEKARNPEERRQLSAMLADTHGRRA
jgi:RNA polymerase sigma-70 factor (ECF subfamily)